MWLVNEGPGVRRDPTYGPDPRAPTTGVRVRVQASSAPASGDRRVAHADGGQEVEQRRGQRAVAGDLELGARGVEPEGLDPRALGPGDARIGLGRVALFVADLAALDVQDVRSRHPVLLDAQLDRAPQAGGRDEPGSVAQDGADVDGLARPWWAPGPAVPPARQRADDRQQVAGALGQLIVHARRHLAVALTREQAVGDHPIEPRAQLLRRDAGQHALQLDEATRAAGEVPDDEQRPLVTHQVERARIGRPL